MDLFAQDNAEDDIKNQKSFCWCLCNEYLIVNVWTNENSFGMKRRKANEKQEKKKMMQF